VLISSDYRATIMRWQNKLLQMPQVEIVPTHYMVDGLYAREITLLKGTLAIGEIHKKGQINVISKGLLYILTEEGVRKVCGGTTFIGYPGAKRAAYVLEDTTWVTISPTRETDMVKIREDLIADTFPIFDQYVLTSDLMGVIEGNLVGG